MNNKVTPPVLIAMSETTATRQKLGEYDVTPVCRNLKIYSECIKTPKLHFSEDRRYFSGVRDLAFASIWISYSF